MKILSQELTKTERRNTLRFELLLENNKKQIVEAYNHKWNFKYNFENVQDLDAKKVEDIIIYLENYLELLK